MAAAAPVSMATLLALIHRHPLVNRDQSVYSQSTRTAVPKPLTQFTQQPHRPHQLSQPQPPHPHLTTHSQLTTHPTTSANSKT